MAEGPARPLTDAEVQALFDRANRLTTLEETRQLYADWAASYDRTITRFGAYLSPWTLAARVAEAGLAPDAPILDVACGTGLLGQALAARGFTCLTGLDLSAAMLDQAAAKGCYRALEQADILTAAAPTPGRFAAVTCAGALTLGHLGAAALEPMVQRLASGGLLAVDIEGGTFDAGGFAAELARLQAQGLLAAITRRAAHFYDPAPGEPPHGWLVTARRP